jgi:uncharacterized protein affecting Mg2+/Co2+ transport
MNLSRETSVAVTHGIRCEATPLHVTPELAAECELNIQMPPSGGFCFAYNIRIENTGDRPVQLLERQWWIRDGDDSEKGSLMPRNPGVVGQSPVLQPGQVFKYGSGSFLENSEGAMSGAFTMQYVGGEVAKGGDAATTECAKDGGGPGPAAAEGEKVADSASTFEARVAPFHFRAAESEISKFSGAQRDGTLTKER